MSQFMLLIRDEGVDFSKYSAKDFQELLKKFGDWSKKMRAEGRLRGGEKLKDDLGKSIRVKDGKPVVDGPYCESREAIAGFYIIEAENMNEVVELAMTCPPMSYGGSLEIREIDKV